MSDRAKPRTCRVCGCTNADCRQCVAKTGRPCWWVGPDLCSACIPPDDPPAAAHNDDLLDAALALIAQAGPAVGSVWRHRKGGSYRVVCCAIREADLVPVVVYQCEYPQGQLFDRKLAPVWTRPLAEFTDGRFFQMNSPRAK